MLVKVLQSLAEANVGEIIRFRYHGGENPGTFRTVRVGEVNFSTIVGTDLDKEAVRQYSFESADTIRMVGPTPAVLKSDGRKVIEETCVSFVDARLSLHSQIDAMNGDSLAEVFCETEKCDAGRFEAQSGMIVVEREVIDLTPYMGVETDLQDDYVLLEWCNKNGEVLGSTITNENRLSVGDTEVDAVEFITKIAEHYGLTIQ